MIFVSLNKKLNKKVLLLILDGWGITNDKDVSAPGKANTPNFNNLIKEYPNNYLITHGEDVGLPKGQMGNSEVGHMNIGAGRIVFQDLAKINSEIENGSFRNNKNLNSLVDNAVVNKKNIHLIGLVSDGGVHSHVSHLYELIDFIESKNNKLEPFREDLDPTRSEIFVKIFYEDHKILVEANRNNIRNIFLISRSPNVLIHRKFCKHPIK